MSTRILLCCLVFWEFVTFVCLAEERDSERRREKTPAFTQMRSACATQCAATLQGRRPLQKSTDVYHDQENFWSDWKVHNKIIDLLSSDKVGFWTDGSDYECILLRPVCGDPESIVNKNVFFHGLCFFE